MKLLMNDKEIANYLLSFKSSRRTLQVLIFQDRYTATYIPRPISKRAKWKDP